MTMKTKMRQAGRIGLVVVACFLVNTFRGLIQVHTMDRDAFLEASMDNDRGFDIPKDDATLRGSSLQKENRFIVSKGVSSNSTSTATNQNLPTSPLQIPRPRFILGIMSHEIEGKAENKLRDALRDTYLSYYKDIDKSTPNRICVLNDLLKSDNPSDMGDCQLAYTFVIGGGSHETERTELLNVTTSSSMLLTHSETDVTSLDIKENGKFGKSPTWFKYATLIQKEYNLPIDYIIKTDSDTLVSPRMFFAWIDEKESEYFFPNTTTNNSDDKGRIDSATASSLIPSSATVFKRERIFGGSPFDKKMCGWPDHDHCENFTAPLYMGGAFYFVSTDLAEYISSDSCPRKKMFIPHEDVTMGNYVFSHPKPITAFENKKGYVRMWRHPLKRSKGIYKKWALFLSQEGMEGVEVIINSRKYQRMKEKERIKNESARLQILNGNSKKFPLATPVGKSTSLENPK